MTQDHSALLAQLDALKSADAGAVLAEVIRAGLQALVEAEAAETIGAGRYRRSDGRTVHRNGHRPKTVSTTAGDIEVQIPKLRAGSFFPSLLERRRRIDRALHAVIMEAYVHGVSTRSVDDLVAAMGVASGVSKSEVSRICAGLDKEIEAFRTRSLTHTSFPYVFCDATFCKVRIGAHVVSQALVVATGVRNHVRADADLAEGGVAEHVRKAGVGQAAGAERLDLLIKASADPGDLGLRHPGGHTHRGDQVIDAAGGNPVHVGLHDHRMQRAVDAPAPLQ